MKPAELRPSDQGATLEIATKTKSRPIRGQILELTQQGAITRVRLSGGFANRWHTLTDANEIQLVD